MFFGRGKLLIIDYKCDHPNYPFGRTPRVLIVGVEPLKALILLLSAYKLISQEKNKKAPKVVRP